MSHVKRPRVPTPSGIPPRQRFSWEGDDFDTSRQKPRCVVVGGGSVYGIGSSNVNTMNLAARIATQLPLWQVDRIPGSHGWQAGQCVAKARFELAQYETDRDHRTRNIVVFQEGVYDLTLGGAAASCGLENAVIEIRARGWEVVMFTSYPTGNSLNGTLLTARNTLNANVRTLAVSTWGCTAIVDVDGIPEIQDANNATNPTYRAPDFGGTHYLTDAGYLLFAQAVKAVMDPLYIAPP